MVKIKVKTSKSNFKNYATFDVSDDIYAYIKFLESCIIYNEFHNLEKYYTQFMDRRKPDMLPKIKQHISNELTNKHNGNLMLHLKCAIKREVNKAIDNTILTK